MRRFRIKAVANIPQRRKAEIRPEESKETKEVKEQPQITAKTKDTNEQEHEKEEEQTIQDIQTEKETEPPIAIPASSHENPTRPEEGFSTFIQRKCKRTEQSRKMAEARRHFIHKFGNTTPDRQRLTMIDLIFYNPTTNPMSEKAAMKRKLEEPPEKVENKSDDGEAEIEAKKPEEDEDVGMPAPQIKIGSNGEIIVDEQSLVIENAETKKHRQELQNTAVVDADFDTSYGVFKKIKRTRDWTKVETLRFYKALNSIGTDFTLMQEFFPRRSRRELKTKFKKEERVNRPLVDRALTQPLPFDTEILKEMAQREENEMTEKQRRIAEVQQTKAKARTIGFNSKEGGIDKMDNINVEKKRKSVTSKVSSNAPVRAKDLYSRLERGIKGVIGNDETEESDNESGSDSSAISVTTILKPTRSGRVPRPAHSRNVNIEEIQLISRAPSKTHSKKQIPAPVVEETQQNLKKSEQAVEPATSDSVERSLYQVFMVGPDQTRTPLTKQLITERLKDKISSKANNDISEGNSERVENPTATEKTANIMKSMSENEKLVIEELAKSIISFSASRVENIPTTFTKLD